MGRVITILEISQKQAYIFGSNKLKDNIANSAIIAYVLSSEYLKESLSEEGYSNENNMVYSGGGHTILTFKDEDLSITGVHSSPMEMARQCTRILTEKIYREFDGLIVFAKTIEYNEEISVKDNLIKLTSALEEKKALRKAVFKKGSFGIEKISSESFEPLVIEKNDLNSKNTVVKKEKNMALSSKISEKNYCAVAEFDKLGGSKNDSNFIAIVHIDGNGMGKRVEDLYEKNGSLGFDDMRKKLKEFSECIDKDFKSAYEEMNESVMNQIERNKILKEKLSLKKKDNKTYFPVRKVIIAGDDICFVSEGRIGIECAVKLIESLNKKINSVDGQNYTACAGVAIVHQKYPFYRAYELAESLCSNAKSFNACIYRKDNGKCLSSIDWHVEFGELGNTIDEIREKYISYDEKSKLYMRPYIIDGMDDDMNNSLIIHKYQRFKERFRELILDENVLSSGKLKEYRNVLREGIEETKLYIKNNRMDKASGTNGITFEREYHKDYDDLDTSESFDVIEIMDTYIPFVD